MNIRLKKLRERYKIIPGKILPRGDNVLALSFDHLQEVDCNTIPELKEYKLQQGEPANQRLRWLKVATTDPDRSGDEMVIEGMVTTNFDRNPQFLWQHGMTNEPVHTIGRIRKIIKTRSAIYALAEYATADESPLAEFIFKMDTAGLLPANSIGFQPIEWEPSKYGGIRFTKWELIECSKVELPCNPFAIDDGVPSASKQLDILEAANLISGQ